jgi:transposase
LLRPAPSEGIGPAGAARILADVADVARFPNRDHFASWNGTAPIDASSGQHIRHRLSRAGNRRSITCSTGRRRKKDIAGYLLGRSPGLLRACILVIHLSLTDWPRRLASG